MDAELPPGRPVGEDGEAQGLPGHGHLRGGAAPGRHEDERHHHRREHRSGGSDLLHRALRGGGRPLGGGRGTREARVMETRQVFEGLAQWEIAVWYTLVAISTAVFAWGVARLVQKYRHGRRITNVDHPVRR